MSVWRGQKEHFIWRRLLAVILAAALLPFASLWQVQAADAVETVSIEVKYGQTAARALAASINALREEQNTGVVSGGAVDQKLEKLAYDYGLEQAAMWRAAEIALVYSMSSRPNGTAPASCYTGMGTVTESIGCETEALIYSRWRESASDFQKMTGADYQAIGIGHVSYNGRDYWVAAYSDIARDTAERSAYNGTDQQPVEVETRLIRSRKVTGMPSATLSLNVGGSYDLSKCAASIQVWGSYQQNEDCPLAGAISVVSQNTAVVSCNGTSLYAQGVGSTTVNVTCGGLVASPFTVEVTKPSISSATIDAIADQMYTGYALRPTVRVRVGSTVLTENIDYTVRYEQNVNVGTAFVTVTGIGKYEGTGSKSAYFRIIAPTVTNATISAIPDQTYTGNAICPAVTVTVNNYRLRENTDYTIFYSNNINIGTATVTITGIGSYGGTKTETFRITGPNMSAATIAAISDQLYTGLDIRPQISVTLNNLTLRENMDYYVSYDNNRNVGTATVTVTGIGNFTGTKTVTFRIIEKDLRNASVSSVSTQRYTGKAICPPVTVKIASVTLQRNVDYTLTYQDNTRPGTARILISGAGSYSGSRTVTFKIAQASLSSATVKVSNQTYNGKAKKPGVTVKLNGKTLYKGDDYTVTYRNNKKPGKATVVIEGNGDYSGTKKAYFVIVPKKMTWISGKAAANGNGRAAALSWKKDSNASGYELYYSKKKSSGYKRIGTLTKNSYTACTHTGLSSGKHYYKIRSYVLVDGKKYYGAFSKIKGVKI